MLPWKLAGVCLGLVSSLACAGEPRRPDGGVGLLAAGHSAPALNGKDQNGADVVLHFPTDQLTVVYFYPKDATPGCTAEACAFRDVWDEYEQRNIRVIAVSNDDIASHREFAETHRLPFSLLADEDGSWARAFGVSSFAGFYSRVTFLLGREGRVLRRYDDVDPGLHAREILRDAASYAAANDGPASQNGERAGDELLAPAPRPFAGSPPTVNVTLHVGRTTSDNTLWVAATLTPPEGAHLYWKHPGESGLATQFEFYPPAGYRVAPARYPGPTRFIGETGRTNFGYGGPVTILAQLEGDGNPTLLGPSVLRAHGSWLSCDSRCVKEEVTKEIAVTTDPLPELDEWLSMLPMDGRHLAFRALLRDRSLYLEAPTGWRIDDAFLEQDLDLDTRAPALTRNGETLVLRPLPDEVPPQVLLDARANDGKRRFITVALAVD
jgi:thioredoxin-dependent peroxiredoxin